MTPSVPAGEVRLLGDSALVIGVHDASGARALAPALEAALAGAGAGAGVAGAEVVCGFGTVAVVLTETGARHRAGPGCRPRHGGGCARGRA